MGLDWVVSRFCPRSPIFLAPRPPFDWSPIAPGRVISFDLISFQSERVE